MGEISKAYKTLVGKPQRKDYLANLDVDEKIILCTMTLREIRWEGVDWLHVAQDRDQGGSLLNRAMDFQFLQTVGNFLHE
jgi:hypothetical protein